MISVALRLGAFAGSVGLWDTNPVLCMRGIVVSVAWKVASWYGLNRFLLPVIGMSGIPHGAHAPPVAGDIRSVYHPRKKHPRATAGQRFKELV
jgi:hypothetical protein